MRKFTPWFVLIALSTTVVSAQTGSVNLGSQVAGLREDVRILVQRVGELSLRVEQLERENAALMQATEGLDRTYATVAQLNEAVAELNTAMTSGDATTQAKAAEAIKGLATQTNSAIDSLAKGMVARAAITTPTFDEDYPSTGLSYTVQKGDTLSSIASRYKSTVRDIQNANQLPNAGQIKIGQTLFIPVND